jgi:D-3-phosphoglycerate dehydrogenase
MLAAINDALAARHINILGQLLKTNETIGYVVIDCAGKPPKDLYEALASIPNTIRTSLF